MRWPTFLLWNALGGTAWATSVALAAYYGGKSVETVFSKVGLYGGLAAVGLIVIGVVYVWRRRRRARARAA
jgi:membrane protein DedA with SNARE-associated domain